MNYKICKECGGKLEATLDNFYVSKHGEKYGLRNLCKKCYNKRYSKEKSTKDTSYLKGLVHEQRGPKNGKKCQNCGRPLRGYERINCPRCREQLSSEISWEFEENMYF